ncbi:MAG: OB-fold domain-containing protein [Ottowia sp.]|uniref:Zn-ribbon domain-containing OB-fold protein n=1 Tax=Ottowia sp. TaxID=1898956 RepID=UPI003C793492
MNTEAMNDWTTGTPVVAYQQCTGCSHVWLFERPFCPFCGRHNPQRLVAAGDAVVYATTKVQRAPSPEFAALTPYAILLVDASEGFRMMAHGDAELHIGDRIRMEFRRFGERWLPYCVAATPTHSIKETTS